MRQDDLLGRLVDGGPHKIPECIFNHAKLYVDTRVMANRDPSKNYIGSERYQYKNLYCLMSQ